MNDFFKSLPSSLPKNEPYYYLSKAQEQVCKRYSVLRPYIAHLPCWVPHRRIADALGFSYKGIDNALKRCGGSPYVWATEFENVHSTWIFDEPSFAVEGQYYRCSESYYHAQKPRPYNDELWKTQRDDVMRTAIYHKFTSSNALKELLISSAPHPLFAIKSSSYWGVLTNGFGENMLARLLMELREQLHVSER